LINEYRNVAFCVLREPRGARFSLHAFKAFAGGEDGAEGFESGVEEWCFGAVRAANAAVICLHIVLGGAGSGGGGARIV
jgi:hypothetical protein